MHGIPRVEQDVTPTRYPLKPKQDVRATRRSISPRRRSIRLCLAPRTHAPWGCIVRVEPNEIKMNTHRKTSLLVVVAGTAAPVGRGGGTGSATTTTTTTTTATTTTLPCTARDPPRRPTQTPTRQWHVIYRNAVMFFGRVIFLDFVRIATRAPHAGPQHVRGAERNRIDRR